MRDNMDNNFDLLVRETMADAEVRVPSRVWKAVSARIGATTPSAGVWTSLWKWAVPSFAVAAAALFFIVTGTTEKTIIENAHAALSIETPQASFEPALCAAEIPPVKSSIRHSTVAETEISEEELPQQEPAGTPSTLQSNPGVAAQPIEEFSDPFALMEAEDARAEAADAGKRKGRLSILAGSSVSANDTHYTSNSFGPFFAPGSRVPNAVEELTQSDYSFPVSLGLTVKYRFTDRLSVGAGLNWTTLSREFEGAYKTETGRCTHRMQYVGIPLHLYYDILQRRGLSLYLTAGGSAEKAVCNAWYFYDQSNSPIYTEPVKGLQYGVDLGFGVEFSLGKHLSIYLDPYVKYWFAGSQPKSVRTEKPILFSFEGGLRFNL